MFDQSLIMLHTAIQTVVGQFLVLVLDKFIVLLLRCEQCWTSLLSYYCAVDSVRPVSCPITALWTVLDQSLVILLRCGQCWTSLLSYYCTVDSVGPVSCPITALWTVLDQALFL